MYNLPYLYLVDKAQSMKYSDDFYNVSKPCFDWYLKIIATLGAKNHLWVVIAKLENMKLILLLNFFEARY